jgi:ribosomal-protein-alanine N-acetyltransferase
VTPPPLQVGRRVLLRRIAPEDRAAFVAGSRASRALHRQWVRPPRTDLEFDRYLARARRGTELYVVCRKTDGAMVGAYNVSEIVRGPLEAANLGYFAFAALAGQGYMGDGLALVLRQVFRRLKLHRIEANVQPDNLASLAMVRRAGFREEGFSPRLLKIGGRWRDHIRFAMHVEDWRALNRRGARPRAAHQAATTTARTPGERRRSPR